MKLRAERVPESGDAELIARRVVDALREEEWPATRGLLKADEAARLLGVEVDWVREHRVALGAVKLGDGPRARLRFPREAIDAYLAARQVGPRRSEEQPSRRKQRHPRRRGNPAPWLRPAGEPVIDW
jgi:hypothetical protein